jgi:hypothetical protein
MSSTNAATGAPALRLCVLDDGERHEVFDVVAVTGQVARVRSPFLFEVGEELAVRLEVDGDATERTARVRAHVGTGDARITELELLPTEA